MLRLFTLSTLISLTVVFQSCSKKKSSDNFSKNSDSSSQQYERGFVREGKVLDVNFDPTLIGAFSAQNEKKMNLDSIGSFFSEFKKFAGYKDEIHQFYKKRNGAYAWFDEDGLTEQADHLAVKLMHLEKDGNLEKLIYHDQFHQMMDNEIDKKDEEKVELMLTSQYIAYSKRNFDGAAGEIAQKTNWLDSRGKFDALEALKIALSNGGIIFPDEPKHQHYVALKNKMLELYKKRLDTVRSHIPTGNYKIGDSSISISKIRERLSLFGDLKNTQKSGLFDEDLLNAVHTFQYRNALDSSDVVGPKTLEKINITGRELLENMFVNLERMRWMSPEKDEYILVNIPQYRLFTFDDSQNFLWDMDVIVGNMNRRTVVFSDKMDYIDFAPYWNIPPGIMKRKILPAMKRNSNYLEKNHMEKTGALAAKGIPAVRQKPGPWNALGKAKFMFPNTYNIYLHDTNEHQLFNRENRDLSSGCVRVADAFTLAKFVLKENTEIDDSIIVKKMNAEKENRVVLKKKMPVHLAYFTTFVDPKGNLILSKDIYNRDKKLKAMLMLNTVEKPEKSLSEKGSEKEI